MPTDRLSYAMGRLRSALSRRPAEPRPNRYMDDFDLFPSLGGHDDDVLGAIPLSDPNRDPYASGVIRPDPEPEYQTPGQYPAQPRYAKYGRSGKSSSGDYLPSSGTDAISTVSRTLGEGMDRVRRRAHELWGLSTAFEESDAHRVFRTPDDFADAAIAATGLNDQPTPSARYAETPGTVGDYPEFQNDLQYAANYDDMGTGGMMDYGPSPIPFTPRPKLRLPQFIPRRNPGPLTASAYADYGPKEMQWQEGLLPPDENTQEAKPIAPKAPVGPSVMGAGGRSLPAGLSPASSPEIDLPPAGGGSAPSSSDGEFGLHVPATAKEYFDYFGSAPPSGMYPDAAPPAGTGGAEPTGAPTELPRNFHQLHPSAQQALLRSFASRGIRPEVRPGFPAIPQQPSPGDDARARLAANPKVAKMMDASLEGLKRRGLASKTPKSAAPAPVSPHPNFPIIPKPAPKPTNSSRYSFLGYGDAGERRGPIAAPARFNRNPGGVGKSDDDDVRMGNPQAPTEYAIRTKRSNGDRLPPAIVADETMNHLDIVQQMRDVDAMRGVPRGTSMRAWEQAQALYPFGSNPGDPDTGYTSDGLINTVLRNMDRDGFGTEEPTQAARYGQSGKSSSGDYLPNPAVIARAAALPETARFLHPQLLAELEAREFPGLATAGADFANGPDFGDAVAHRFLGQKAIDAEAGPDEYSCYADYTQGCSDLLQRLRAMNDREQPPTPYDDAYGASGDYGTGGGLRNGTTSGDYDNTPDEDTVGWVDRDYWKKKPVA